MGIGVSRGNNRAQSSKQVPLSVPLSPTKDSNRVDPWHSNPTRYAKTEDSHAPQANHRTLKQSVSILRSAARGLDEIDAHTHLEGNSFRGHDHLNAKVGSIYRHHLPQRDAEQKKSQEPRKSAE